MSTWYIYCCVLSKLTPLLWTIRNGVEIDAFVVGFQMEFKIYYQKHIRLHSTYVRFIVMYDNYLYFFLVFAIHCHLMLNMGTQSKIPSWNIDSCMYREKKPYTWKSNHNRVHILCGQCNKITILRKSCVRNSWPRTHTHTAYWLN